MAKNEPPSLPSRRVLFAKPTRRKQRRRAPPALDPGPIDVTVRDLSHRGEGVVDTPLGRRFIPMTLPGDRIRLVRAKTDRLSAEVVFALDQVLEPSPHRVAARCPHFGTCGGCAVQHLEDATYRLWKREQVVLALGQHGIRDVAVAPLVGTTPGTRRRASLSFRRRGRTAVLGFRRRQAHDIVDVERCPVLRPELTQLLIPLRALIGAHFPDGLVGQVDLTLCEGGIDVVVADLPPPDRPLREVLARFAGQHRVIRVAWLGRHGFVDLVVQHGPPTVRFGGTAVAMPPGAFLQATEEAETELTRLVVDAVGSSERVIDLFCGLGTFALPLARGAAVHAVDGDAAMVAALKAAAAQAPRSGPPLRLTVEQRDLARRPFLAADLKRFAAVILDPPRAGAPEQAAQLAGARVPLVIAVSCNSATFARDARTLVDGGYRLDRVAPVDQFLWAPHIELVAVFCRP
ncbi:MAG: class I SAM-dependent RNA methyltransferase [Alphaproteobacteria bacterium]|nr:class I SAM-dependent RNA methyltransferase [Alphaproteobacteria bacterium]